MQNKIKTCRKCGKNKDVKNFGFNKGYLRSYCKSCHSKMSLERKKSSYFVRKLKHIQDRCRYDKASHYYKKYNCTLTIHDIKYIWNRDCGYLLKNPSIDRVNSDGDYTLENCRFIELKNNKARYEKISETMKKYWSKKKQSVTT